MTRQPTQRRRAVAEAAEAAALAVEVVDDMAAVAEGVNCEKSEEERER